MKIFVFLVLSFNTLFSLLSFSQQWKIVTPVLNTPPNGGAVVSGFSVYNQRLYVAGGFKKAGNTILNNIAFFDSVNWYPLGTGINYAGGSWPVQEYNGNIIIGGLFTIRNDDSITYSYINNLASWNGSVWDTLGHIGNPSSTVKIITKYNNNLYIGGSFGNIGTVSIGNIAMWNGTTWSSVGGAGGASTDIYALAVYNNELYAGGYFFIPGIASEFNIARWDGTQWHSVGSGLNDMVTCMFTDTVANVLYAGGNFHNPANSFFSVDVARWDGTTWSYLGNGFNNRASALCMYKGYLYAGGMFTTSADGTQTFNHIARWDGTSWQPLGVGTDFNVQALQTYKGELYIGGDFNHAGGLLVRGLAKWYMPTAMQQGKISGTVTYNNTANTEISQVSLTLKQGNTNIVTTTTDATGNYSFYNIPDGTYTISATCTLPWNGVTATDALIIDRHVAGLSILPEPNISAADVTFNNGVTGADALLVKRRVVGLQNYFVYGDWYFNPQPITVLNANVVMNFKGICYGDVNGSYVPANTKK